MVQRIQSVMSWLQQPDFEDQEDNLSALYIQSIALVSIVVALILGVVYAAVGQIGYVAFMAADILIQIVMIGLVRSKKIRSASNLFLVVALALLTMGVLSAGSIHASSVILYPVLLLFASLLIDRKSYSIYVLLCVASIGFIVYAENQKFAPPYKPDPPDLALFLSVSLMVISIAFIARFITESLQNSIRTSRRYVRELSNQKAMLDRVGQAVVGCLLDNTIIYWNQAAVGLYGLEANDAIGRKYYDVVPTQMTPEMSEGIRSALRSGDVWSGELAIQKRDQSSLTVLGTVSALRDSAGAVIGWIGIAADLSDRVKLEAIDKRRAEEMSLLYRLGVLLASGENLYDTLLALQIEIVKFIQVDAFYVAIYHEATDIVSYPIFFDESHSKDDTQRLLHERPGLTGAVIFGGKTLYLPDMFEPEVEIAYNPVDDNVLPVHTFLGVPLISNGHTIGMLSVQSKQIDAYTPDQIQLIENIAVQAAIAIDKADLLDQLKQELGERTLAEAQLHEREAILESITFAAEQFLKSSEWHANMNQVLERLGKTLRVTHVYLFEDHLNSQGEAVTSMRYEWTAAGYPSDLDGPYFQDSKIEQEGYEEQVSALRRGDVRIGNSATFNPIEKENMEALGVKSILEVPIFVNEREWGAIGFDDFEQEREWNRAEVEALKIAAGVLSAAIQRQEAEAAVRESERIYRQAIEAAGAVPYYRDYRTDSYQFIGQGFQRLTGYAPEEMREPFWNSIVQEYKLVGDLAGFDLKEAGRRVRNGEFNYWKCDYRILAQGGRSKWVADSSIELFDASGTSYGSIGIMQDITERKQIEASLRQREAMLAAATYAAEQFLKSSDWRLNVDQVLERLGKTFHASHVYLFEHFIGAHEVEYSALKYEWTATGHASDLESPYYQVPNPINLNEDSTDHDLRHGRIFIGNADTFPPAEKERLLNLGVKAMVEVPLFVDGAWWGTFGVDDFEAERDWSIAEVDALKIAAGILSGAIQRQEAESAVHESERIYRQAIGAAGAVPYYRNYAKNNYEFVGSGIEKMIGYKPEEITTELWLNIMKENIPLGEGEGLPIDEAVTGSRSGRFKVWRSDMRVTAKNGETKWITDSSVELFDEAEYSYASVGILHDVTDRKLIEVNLRKREAILEAITFAAEQFLKAHNWRDHINVVLERLGKEVNASHAYLFEKHTGTDGVLLGSLRYEWTAPGQKPEIDNPAYQNAVFDEDEFRQYYAILDSGEPFVGNTSYFLEAADAEQTWMASTGIYALLEMRIVVDGRQWGTIGFDDMVGAREWTPMEVDVLRVASNVLGAAIKRQMDEAALQRELDERKRAEQALRLSEEKFSKAFHTTQVLMTIEDTRHLFIDANKAFIEAFGFDRNEIVGHSASELNIYYDPADATRLRQTLDEQGFLKDFEMRYRRGSGELGFVILSSEDFLVDNVQYTLTSGLDITERKRAEENYRSIFNNSIDGIFQSTDDGHFVNVNPAMARIYGYDSPEDMMRSVNDIGTQIYVDAEQRYDVRQRLASGERLVGYETLDRRKDGSTFWASMTAQAVMDGSEKVLYYEGTVEDVTSRRQAVAEREKLMTEMEAKNEELERFTYTVSHDLKSPLVTINGFLGYLEIDAASGNMERLKKDTQRIQEAVNKMQRLLNELLELSRIGRMMNAPENVPFTDLAREAMDIVHGQLEARGVTVQTQPNLPRIHGDRQRLTEVLQNLLDNAVKYMGAQPSPLIEIGQRGEQDGKPVFFVRDNGMGIAPEYHERVFGLFNKLDAKSEGTGVGLALVKRIIEVHGGRIWVESELGHGSTFLFTLPPFGAAEN
ncbi:MAG: PAS domain S-box protein [Chloroflexota bacterium]